MSRLIFALTIALVACSFLAGAFVTYVTKPVYIVTATQVPITRSGLGFIPHEARCQTRTDFYYCFGINGYGFRGHEPRDDSRCRVAVVGSSFAFAAGVGDADTWLARLEDDRVQPFNLAFPGATMFDMIDVARSAQPLLHYDALVVAVTPAYDDSHAAWGGHVDARDGQKLKQLEAGLRPFQDLKVPVLFVVLSSLPGQDHGAVLALGNKLGWTSVAPAFSKGDFYPEDGHYTVEANQRLAAQLAPEIRKLCATRR